MKWILLHMIPAFMFMSLSVAQVQVSDSISELEKSVSEEELARMYTRLSIQLGDSIPDSALFYANRAELILQKDDPDNLLPTLYKSKGRIYNTQQVRNRSLLYYRKAYDGFIKLNDHHEIGDCALQLGNLYYEIADFSEAYFFYMNSLHAYEQAGDRLGIASMQNNLGTVAHEMGKLQEAENHYHNAFDIYMETGTVEDQCRSLNNIGLILYDRHVYDSALVCFNEALGKLDPDTVTAVGGQRILSSLYNNIALVYSDMGEPSRALTYLREGLSLALRINNQYNIGSVYTNLGSVYGDINNQDSALYYLHRALSIAKKRGFRHLELEVYNELSKLHAGIGNYGSAYNWQLRYDTVYKSVFNEIQSEQIARLRSRYEQELKDREIEQLQSESQVQRTLNKVFIISIGVIIVLVIIIAVNLRSRKRVNLELAERNLQISKAVKQLSESEKELQKLNMSKDRIFTVVAHDLRNPVAAVSGFSELLYDNFEEFPVETQKEYLLQILQGTQRIQSLLENLLIWARAQMKAIKFEPEVLKMRGIVEDTIKELKANLEHKKVTCIVKIDRKCMVYADKSMIHTVFRNLIMNAVKFSFPGGKIWITSTFEKDQCQIAVSDEGIGIQPEIQEKLFNSSETISTPGTTGESGSGLGLVICKEFLMKNNGTISVESDAGNGSKFIISLPVSKMPDPI